MATKRYEIYKCLHCGNLVMVLAGHAGTLSCCGDAMTLLEENTVDASHEKHVPVIEKSADGYKVKVGAVEHPMTDEHHIAFIELITEDDAATHIKFLKPGEKPEAEFKTKATKVSAREFCNLHGLWVK